MKLRRDKTQELMESDFNGNYTRFASAINVDASHIHRFIKTGVGGGKQVIGGIMKYCKEHGKNPFDYIDLN